MNNQESFQAVVYLMNNMKEAPETTKEFLEELTKYDSSGKSLDASIEEAQNTIITLRTEMQKMYGAIEALTKMTVSKLTKEQITEFSKKQLAQQTPEEEKV